jgi:hypothetical protein
MRKHANPRVTKNLLYIKMRRTEIRTGEIERFTSIRLDQTRLM